MINFHRASLALNKLIKKRQLSKTSAKQGQNNPADTIPPESTAAGDPQPDPSETMELEVLRRLGKEYMRLLKGPASTGSELMEPLDCVKLLYAFTEVDFHPGEGAKGLMVRVDPRMDPRMGIIDILHFSSISLIGRIIHVREANVWSKFGNKVPYSFL